VIKSKLINDGAWKEVLAKNKGVKDNGLLKTLADIKKLGEEDHDDAQAILDQIQKLAGQLKKSKEIAAAPAVGKFLAELTSAADTAVRDVAKAKAEADKKAKAELEAKKREEHKGGKEEEGEEESDDATELLTTKLVPLLRQVAKGQVMHTLVAKSGKQVVVMLSRKPISPSRRKLLADQLGGGSTKYYPGHCSLEGGATTFALKAEVAGMAKLIKAALLEQTGLRLNKVKCRGEDGDDNDEDEPTAAKGKTPEDAEAASGKAAEDSSPSADDGGKPPTGMTRPFELSASVGRGGKNLEEDVQAVQAALNRRMDAKLDVDGRCGTATINAIMAFQKAIGQSRPDGRVDPGRGTANKLAGTGKLDPPPPPPSPKKLPDLGEPVLNRAPLVWHGMRDVLDHNIGELKRAIRQEYADENPRLLAEIDQNVQRVDVILEKLDDRLAHALERANGAREAKARKVELDSAKAIMADYVGFIKGEPLIDHIDKNPFGVDTQLRKSITDSLKHVAKAMS